MALTGVGCEIGVLGGVLWMFSSCITKVDFLFLLYKIFGEGEDVAVVGLTSVGPFVEPAVVWVFSCVVVGLVVVCVVAGFVSGLMVDGVVIGLVGTDVLVAVVLVSVVWVAEVVVAVGVGAVVVITGV